MILIKSQKFQLSSKLEKEMNVPIDLSDPINYLKQEIENFNFPRDD